MPADTPDANDVPPLLARFKRHGANHMIELASVLLLGIGAQWVAWRLKLPSILLLLLTGFVVGPITGWLDPDRLLGEAFLPIVSLSVATILFEGGLTLRLRELAGAGAPAVRNLILFGSPMTWALAACGTHWILGLSWGISLLIGGILVVTGPTVIVPLLRHVRPSGAVSSVVRWEGIVGDPIGALFAVLVFQAISTPQGGVGGTVSALSIALVAGGAFGAIGAWLLVQALRRDLIPDYLQSPAALALALGAFCLPNLFQHESGLIAVTLMGIIVANQKDLVVEHIVEFKENLQVLLISSLFILLAARLPTEELRRIDGTTALFVAFLILIVRPLTVFVTTIGTGLTWRERGFIAWMAPRGIVAAAVASVFALELARLEHPGADRIVSVVFAVIIGTVAVYGLTARPVARFLGLSDGDPQGLLLVGAQPWARALAQAVHNEGIEVRLIDRNWENIRAARMQGLLAHYANVMSEELEEEVPLHGLGSLLCLTYNDQVNSLACLKLARWFGRASTFQVTPEGEANGDGDASPGHLRGRTLGTQGLTYWDWESRFRDGAVFKRTKLSEEFGLDDFRAQYSRGSTEPAWLFVLRDGRLEVCAGDEEPTVQAGDTLVALVYEPNEKSPDRETPVEAS